MWGLIQDPAPGKAAPPLSLSASAPRSFPSLRRRWMGRSATLQRRRQQLLLPSPGGCPGGHCQQPLSGPEPNTQLLPKEPRSAALLAAPPPAPAAFGQRGIGAEEAPADDDDTARKQRPGRCCYPTPPTLSGCNALRPASAPLLPAGAGLVRAAVCRCGSSPSPRCPPPPRVPRPPPSRSLAPAAATAAATEVGDAPLFYGRAAWAALRAAKAVAIRAQSARTRMPAAERSGAPN